MIQFKYLDFIAKQMILSVDSGSVVSRHARQLRARAHDFTMVTRRSTAWLQPTLSCASLPFKPLSDELCGAYVERLVTSKSRCVTVPSLSTRRATLTKRIVGGEYVSGPRPPRLLWSRYE